MMFSILSMMNTLITNIVTKRFTVDKKVKKSKLSVLKDKLSKDKKENKKIEETVEKRQNLDR